MSHMKELLGDRIYTEEPATIEICDDCVSAIANGEVFDGRGVDITDAHYYRMAHGGRVDPNARVTLGATDCEWCPTESGEDCEPRFSWEPCPHCGSNLGGNRSHATVWPR